MVNKTKTYKLQHIKPVYMILEETKEIWWSDIEIKEITCKESLKLNGGRKRTVHLTINLKRKE